MEEVQSFRGSRKAKAVLARLIQGKQLTPEGLNWLAKSLDMFHDTPLTASGLPDGQNTRTTVQEIRKQIQVSKPTTHTALNTWECRIDITPLIQSYSSAGNWYLTPGSIVNGGSAPTGLLGTVRFYGGVSVNSCDSGVNMFSVAGATSSDGLMLPATDDPRRVIGISFEVLNTTPQLYAGGAVTVFRNPTSVSKSNAWYTGVGVLQQNAHIASGLTTSYDVLTNNPDTLTWEAMKGCYVTGTLPNVEDTEFTQFTPAGIMLSPWTANIAGTQVLWWGQAGNPPQLQDFRLQNINFGGAWFTGLHENSTLTITAKYLVEDLVPVSDTNFPFSRPAPMRDDVALEIYSRALAEMPAGCTQGENPLGEWFNTVMDAIGDWAPKIGSLLPGFGGIAGNAVSTLAKGAGAWNRSAAASEAAQRPPPIQRPPSEVRYLQQKKVEANARKNKKAAAGRDSRGRPKKK